jgi:dihydrofolate reductase
MKITAIVTCNKYGGIGQGKSLPWPELYFGRDNFNVFVGDNPVLIGNNSYRLMSQIKHIDNTKKFFIYTQNVESNLPATITTVSGAAQEVIDKISEDETIENLFIAGGEEVFRIFYNLIDEWIITVLDEHQLQFDKMIPLNNIQNDWPVTKELTSGVDHYQHFNVIKYSKE